MSLTERKIIVYGQVLTKLKKIVLMRNIQETKTIIQTKDVMLHLPIIYQRF